MITRRSAVTILASLGLVPSTMTAWADAPLFQDYSPAAFEAAIAAGKPVLVAIHAGWCPTCRVQRSILSGLMIKPEFKDLLILRVDFDGQRPVVAGFGAHSQSTLIMFKGKAEMGRSVGDTNEQRIEELLRSGI